MRVCVDRTSPRATRANERGMSFLATATIVFENKKDRTRASGHVRHEAPRFLNIFRRAEFPVSFPVRAFDNTGSIPVD